MIDILIKVINKFVVPNNPEIASFYVENGRRVYLVTYHLINTNTHLENKIQFETERVFKMLGPEDYNHIFFRFYKNWKYND